MLELKEKINGEYLVFSGNVKKYRLMKGITQEKLAEVTDLSLSYIKQIESKKEFKNSGLSSRFIIYFTLRML